MDEALQDGLLIEVVHAKSNASFAIIDDGWLKVIFYHSLLSNETPKHDARDSGISSILIPMDIGSHSYLLSSQSQNNFHSSFVRGARGS